MRPELDSIKNAKDKLCTLTMDASLLQAPSRITRAEAHLVQSPAQEVCLDNGACTPGWLPSRGDGEPSTCHACI